MGQQRFAGATSSHYYLGDRRGAEDSLNYRVQLPLMTALLATCMLVEETHQKRCHSVSAFSHQG